VAAGPIRDERGGRAELIPELSCVGCVNVVETTIIPAGPPWRPAADTSFGLPPVPVSLV
jgi:hypothetical protein